MKTWKDVGSRWAGEVGAALGFTAETPLLGLSEEVDYQGSCYFVARLAPDEIVMYGWSYGSCSGCDSWEDHESEIAPEVQGAAQRMTLAEFRAYAAPVLDEKPPEWDGYPSNRKAVAEAIATLGADE
jgi:hypothetical protein